MKRTATITVIFIILMCVNLSPEKIAEFENVYKPSMMDIANGEIFILDGFSIKVFSLGDYSFLREFSKQGEGPGEINAMNDTDLTMIVKGKKILLNSVHKIIIFDKSGKVIREKKFRELVVEAIPFKKGYVITFNKWIDATAHAITKIYDESLDEVKGIYKARLPQSYKIQKFSIPPLTTYVRCTKDKIFMFDQNKDTISVYNHKGDPQGEIAFKHERVIANKAFKNKVLKDLNEKRNKKIPEDAFKKFLGMVYIPEILPVFKNSWIIDDRIYIHTWREKGNKGEFIILDMSGKVKDKKLLPGSTQLKIKLNPTSTFTFYEGEYYYLLENLDQEEWELHKMKLN